MSEEKFTSPMTSMPKPKPTPKPTPTIPMQPQMPPQVAPITPMPLPTPVTPPQMPQMPAMPQVPVPPQMPVMSMPVMPTMVSPCDLLMMLRPVVKHGCRELPKKGPKHTLTEVAMIAFLMGTGMDYRTAYMLVESWEVHETFFRDND